MFKIAFFAKAGKAVGFFIVNISLLFSQCTKAPVQTAVAEPYVQSAVEEEEDLCSSEGINFPENDVEKALEKTLDDASSDYADDPTEDTESESEPEEVKEVDGKIVPVDELIKVPDTDKGKEVLSEVGPSALFDENGNIIKTSDEDDLCSSEGINFPENDKEYDDGMDAVGESHDEYSDDPTEDTESESEPEEVKSAVGPSALFDKNGKLIKIYGEDLPASERVDDPTEDTESESEPEEVKSEVGPSALFDEDGNIIKISGEDLPASERVDDPTEDTESESEPVEVKEVNGEIVEA